MKYEWDPTKNESNCKKHGIWFEEAVEIFKGLVLTAISDSTDYGEIRKISIGELPETIVIVVIHTRRNKKSRIISARRANKKERDKYYEYIENFKKAKK